MNMDRSNALSKCTHRPGWLKGFLASVKNGYSDINAARGQGISTAMVRRYLESNPDQMEIYKYNLENQVSRRDGRW